MRDNDNFFCLIILTLRETQTLSPIESNVRVVVRSYLFNEVEKIEEILAKANSVKGEEVLGMFLIRSREEYERLMNIDSDSYLQRALRENFSKIYN